MQLPFKVKEGQVVTVEKIPGTSLAICKERLWSIVFAIADGGMPNMCHMRPDLMSPASVNAYGYQAKVLLLTCQVRKDL
jgi:hypothetical protein